MRHLTPFREMKRSQSGLAVLEFALILPILILVLLGAIELSRYVIIHQKLDKAANALADYVTQGTSVTREALDAFADAVDPILSPFGFDGTVVFTSVVFYSEAPAPCTGTDTACVAWQYSPVGDETSRIGQPGGNAVIPGNYGAEEGQNAIIAEVFLNYRPMLTGTPSFIGTLAPHTIYKVAVYKPRLNSLSELD